LIPLIELPKPPARASVDNTPWAHPFLRTSQIARFKAYSEQVWAAALAHRERAPRQLNAAFAVNLAQTSYKWAQLAQSAGSDATLYLHPQDASALSRPEWEEFDGEFADVFDGAGFLRAHPELAPRVPCVMPPNEGGELLTAYTAGVDSPAAAALRERSPSVRHPELLSLLGMYPYFAWAELLARHEVTMVSSAPFAAFASGKPYCIFSVGGDLQFDCGRTDALGQAMRMSFDAGRFILASNPHTLGHCRRLGFNNPVYFPYAMDSDRYCPGDGVHRREWAERFGGDVFVLATARIDSDVKGHTPAMIDALFRIATERPGVRFVFLGWGKDVERLKARAAAIGLHDRIVVLPPVGKTRLIDYYRSADIVLDQFVMGYLGATALEAAAIGKPVVMHLRDEQYQPLYSGDVPPVEHADSAAPMYSALMRLIDSPTLRAERGGLMREWLVRNHGQERMTPLLVALLQFTADNGRLPDGLDNPLDDALSAEEIAYHEACLQP
jgi:glycosyltransferase involved in cell wall biosynthesis